MGHCVYVIEYVIEYFKTAAVRRWHHLFMFKANVVIDLGAHDFPFRS